ncbi:porin [Sphingomonas piscis]|uniref:Porin n=2 Tax=Sphingomonas piscis TaxID=2714943 RepID=A0A6G7YTD0_9SPHN|nr:porin [Sphingomonas piscis]
MLPFAALAAAAVVLTPAAGAPTKRKPGAVSLSFDPVFTPANADPRLAAAFARRGSALGDLKFTPAAAQGRPSQVRIAIRAPAAKGSTPVTRAAATSATTLTPTSYNLGVGVGWRRFALAGDVAKSSETNPSIEGRESASVGVSYSLKQFTGQVAVNADRGDGRGLAALRRSDNYSLDVGASYNVSRRIAVTGGVRYRIDRDRLAPVADNRRDSQAVYVGTAFKF